MIFFKITITIFIVFCSKTISAEERTIPHTCTYEAQSWNVALKRSVDRKTIRHPYSKLMPEEIDPITGCTVCKEDQELISLPPLKPFSVCYKIAPRVKAVLEILLQKEAPIFTVIGYHVIRSRGALDRDGNRTGFSNHSYGTAIDINPSLNGLYDNCFKFGANCRLIRGGKWRQGLQGALEYNSDIVKAFKTIGFHWGGEIEGRQKDFMHFSPTGY